MRKVILLFVGISCQTIFSQELFVVTRRTNSTTAFLSSSPKILLYLIRFWRPDPNSIQSTQQFRPTVSFTNELQTTNQLSLISVRLILSPRNQVGPTSLRFFPHKSIAKPPNRSRRIDGTHPSNENLFPGMSCF